MYPTCKIKKNTCLPCGWFKIGVKRPICPNNRDLLEISYIVLFSVMILHYHRLHIKFQVLKQKFRGYKRALYRLHSQNTNLSQIIKSDLFCQWLKKFWIYLRIPWNARKSTLSDVVELEPTYTIGSYWTYMLAADWNCSY